MTLHINGQPREVPEPTTTVRDLLEDLELESPVLVELNGTALLQREWADQLLRDGDRLELFRMVAGG